jgi:NADH-quinone oxidoreductase subunit H
MYVLFFCVSSILIYLPFLLGILLAVAFYTLAERKIMGSMQRRHGPNVVGFWGVLQPFSDALKLILKEFYQPTYAEKKLFWFGPFLMLVISLVCWLVIPFSANGALLEFNLSLLFLYAFNSLSAFGIILSGWASNSKYSFLGSLRSAAQMLAYEVSLGFVYLFVGACSGSYNLVTICLVQQETIFFCYPLLPVCVIFYITMLAETNRIPFDLPEAEAELVAGYNTEYSSMGFTAFFLAEYSNMLLMCFVIVICFFGGWSGGACVFILKIVGFAFTLIWVRATLPRYRYDQLMLLGWKIFLPIIITFFLFYISFSFYTDAFIWGFLPASFVLK